jgi:hypothetical protein
MRTEELAFALIDRGADALRRNARIDRGAPQEADIEAAAELAKQAVVAQAADELKAPDVEVLIESNNASIRETCPLCGAAHKDADLPHWFFVANKRGLCGDCARTYYPDELNLLSALNKFWRQSKEPDIEAVCHLLQSVNANMRTPAAVVASWPTDEPTPF